MFASYKPHTHIIIMNRLTVGGNLKILAMNFHLEIMQNEQVYRLHYAVYLGRKVDFKFTGWFIVECDF